VAYFETSRIVVVGHPGRRGEFKHSNTDRREKFVHHFPQFTVSHWLSFLQFSCRDTHDHRKITWLRVRTMGKSISEDAIEDGVDSVDTYENDKRHALKLGGLKLAALAFSTLGIIYSDIGQYSVSP